MKSKTLQKLGLQARQPARDTAVHVGVVLLAAALGAGAVLLRSWLARREKIYTY
ncbi:MAG: hypothetical protein QM817_10605 [Archangium sp.]